MARIVLMKDTKPLVLKKAEMEDDAVFICRCGLSAEWPYCDSSHATARKEEPGTVYAYTRATPEDAAAPRTVTDVPDADPRPWDAGTKGAPK